MAVRHTTADIPPELFPRVLGFFEVYPTQAQLSNASVVHADKHMLATLCLVCRFWARTCQWKIFERVTLRSRDDVQQLAVLVDNPDSKTSSYVRSLVCEVSLSKDLSTAPWLHLLQTLYPKLPSLTFAGYYPVSIHMTGPLSSHYRTIRTIHWSVPRSAPSFSRGIYMLQLKDVHVTTFHDLLHLVQEMEDLRWLECVHVTWDVMPSVFPWKRPTGKGPNERKFQVNMSSCTDDWTALWLCATSGKSLAKFSGEDLLHVGRLVGSFSGDFNKCKNVVACAQRRTGDSVGIVLQADASEFDRFRRDLRIYFAVSGTLQHVTHIEAVLPFSQFQDLDVKEFNKASSHLFHLEKIRLRFYQQDDINRFAQTLQPQIIASVGDKLVFELWTRTRSGYYMWLRAHPDPD